jgi:hypothetical protein
MWFSFARFHHFEGGRCVLASSRSSVQNLVAHFQLCGYPWRIHNVLVRSGNQQVLKNTAQESCRMKLLIQLYFEDAGFANPSRIYKAGRVSFGGFIFLDLLSFSDGTNLCLLCGRSSHVLSRGQRS